MSGMLIFVLVLIAALIVTLYMVYKKGDSSPASSPAPAPSGPTIDVQGIERTLNPDKSDNGTSPSTSGYVIREYSNGTGNFDYIELTKNVVITLKWDNQGGFDSVTALKAVWQVKGDGETDYVTRMTKTITRSNDQETFKNYSRGNTISFTGNTDLLTGESEFSAVGDNIVHLYYTTSTVTDQQLTPDVDSVNYTPWTINIGDLSATLDMVEPKTYNYVPNKSDISLGRGQTHTNYKIYSKLFKDDISILLISNVIDDYYSKRSVNPYGYIRFIPVVDTNGTVQKSKIKLAYVSKEDETVKKGVGVAGLTPGINLEISPRGDFAGFYDDASINDATNNPYIGVTDNIDDSYIFNIVPVYESDNTTVKYIRFQDSDNPDRFMCLRKVKYTNDNSGGAKYNAQVCLKKASELSFCEKESIDFILVEGDGVPPTFTSDAFSVTSANRIPNGECEIYAPNDMKYSWRCQKYTKITDTSDNYERREEIVPDNVKDSHGNSFTCDNGIQE
jgi:hypothetical protein